MEQHLKKRLKALDIDYDSELGQSLKKLDFVYDNIKNIDFQIKFLQDKKQQLIEDADMMELLLMHKLNKDSRTIKWRK